MTPHDGLAPTMSTPVREAAVSNAKPLPREETRVHTRLQRLALGAEESRAYWPHALEQVATHSSRAKGELAARAFAERWFGARSLERVRTLLAYLTARYNAFPHACAALARWRQMEPDTRRAICHVHLQLTDPLYRAFTSQVLPARRASGHATLDRDGALRWMRTQNARGWGEPTLVQFASKLLSAASEAGLLSPAPDPRTLPLPRVPDDALTYVMYLLREVRFEGTLVDNAYLRSLGLIAGPLDQRLRATADVKLQRVGHVWDLEWRYPNLSAWAEARTA